MKKTSVYLSNEDEDRLEWLARLEGASRAAIIRRAIAGYVPQQVGDRNFAGAGSGEGPGDSVCDLSEEELLQGFGE